MGPFADYAADYFQTADSDDGKVILALRKVVRWMGQDIEVLRNAYLSNNIPPTQRDFAGYNVSYEVASSHGTESFKSAEDMSREGRKLCCGPKAIFKPAVCKI